MNAFIEKSFDINWDFKFRRCFSIPIFIASFLPIESNAINWRKSIDQSTEKQLDKWLFVSGNFSRSLNDSKGHLHFFHDSVYTRIFLMESFVSRLLD